MELLISAGTEWREVVIWVIALITLMYFSLLGPDMQRANHSNQLFGTWHRPYLSMIEVHNFRSTILYRADNIKQLLHEHAVSIAAEFPSGSTGTKYRDAAAKLRLPYWDWAQKPASGQPTVPKSISAVTTTVKYPNGTQASILNPLYSYRFHPLNGNVFVSNSQDHVAFSFLVPALILT